MKNRKWAIVIIIGEGHPLLRYVSGYSNTYASPTYSTQEGAKRFDTREEALQWGNKYLVAYNWHFTSVPVQE